MPKEFYTERDIEDMFERGILSLQVNNDVVLTELAFEKANRLGMQLLRGRPFEPHVQPEPAVEPPSAPVRPYISQIRMPETPATAASAPSEADLTARIRAAVLAQLGSQVDPALLDVIIQRVLKSTGVK